jgi:hypothetical protein
MTTLHVPPTLIARDPLPRRVSPLFSVFRLPSGGSPCSEPCCLLASALAFHLSCRFLDELSGGPIIARSSGLVQAYRAQFGCIGLDLQSPCNYIRFPSFLKTDLQRYPRGEFRGRDTGIQPQVRREYRRCQPVERHPDAFESFYARAMPVRSTFPRARPSRGPLPPSPDRRPGDLFALARAGRPSSAASPRGHQRYGGGPAAVSSQPYCRSSRGPVRSVDRAGRNPATNARASAVGGSPGFLASPGATATPESPLLIPLPNSGSPDQ